MRHNCRIGTCRRQKIRLPADPGIAQAVLKLRVYRFPRLLTGEDGNMGRMLVEKCSHAGSQPGLMVIGLR
ncbi:hypothetical protein DMH27_09225 [Raoultella planticola]|nr:hypothetical protein [Raoultella planticola]